MSGIVIFAPLDKFSQEELNNMSLRYHTEEQLAEMDCEYLDIKEFFNLLNEGAIPIGQFDFIHAKGIHGATF